MLLIHSETVLLLAFAASVIRFRPSALNRTGTIRPFASPFGSIGLPISLTDARVVDTDTHAALPVGQVGELAIRAPQVMQGYWNQPQETAQSIQDGWFYTTFQGKQVKLSQEEKEAQTAFHSLHAQEPDDEPKSYRDSMKYDRDLAARFTAVAQEEGVYFHTLWHSGLSAMHTAEDVDEALTRIERAAKRVAATKS